MPDRIADLLLEKGRAQAAGHLGRGAAWGAGVQNVGTTFANLAQQYPQMQAAQRQEQADAQLRELFQGPEMPSPDAVIRIVGPERGMPIVQGLSALSELQTKRITNARDTAGRLAAGVKALPATLQAEWWPSIRQAAIEGGIGDASSIPEQATPEYLDAVIGWSTGKAPEAPKIGTREIRVKNADGSESIQIVEDKPGFSATSAAPAKEAPKPGSEEDFINRFAAQLGRPVEQLTAAQIESARRRYAASTRFVDPSAARGTERTLVSPTGEQRVANNAAEANQLLDQGWKFYDATTVRNAPGRDTLIDTQVARAVDGLKIIDALITVAPGPDGAITPNTKDIGKGLDRSFGSIQGAMWDFSQASVDVRAAIERLSSLVTLPEMQSLRGLGPASDRDVKIVENGATMLKNARISDEAARKELARIRDAFLRLKAAGEQAQAARGRGAVGGGAPADPLGIR